MALCRFMSLFGCTVGFIIVVIILQLLIEEFVYSSSNVPISSSYNTDNHVALEDVTVPVILWWTPFTGERGSIKQCGSEKCFFTDDRKFWHHPLLKVIMFYGSKFDVLDLPLPRNGAMIKWALFHEESPKNTPVLSHEKALQLFNVTATFSRGSSFPLTLQYLQNAELLTGHKYLINLETKNRLLKKISPVLYIHSDCDTPLERDSYVKELMKYIPVDSYGACLQNKKLPKSLADPMESMDSEEFFHFVARYKFTLAFENSVCDDYITEKLWRPLIVGSLPVYLGSPSVQDWLPNDKSVIHVADFDSPKKLAEYLHEVNDNDTLYETYFEHKSGKISNKDLIISLNSRTWGIGYDFEKGNMVEHFECFVCERNSYNQYGMLIANKSHYNCPPPVSPLTRKRNEDNWWLEEWKKGGCEAEALIRLVNKNISNYTRFEYTSEVKMLSSEDLC